jgi:cyclophilin family peptidyl-prolyl cis-trans isomerase
MALDPFPAGPGTNGSQFFLCTVETGWVRVLFGCWLSGNVCCIFGRESFGRLRFIIAFVIGTAAGWQARRLWQCD